jgi:hypothetical protein
VETLGSPGRFRHSAAGTVLAFIEAVSIRQIKAKTRVDCFAWQYAFHARLVYGRAPMAQAELIDLTRAVHAFRGHLDPIAAADEILLTWPFDVTEWGGLP